MAALARGKWAAAVPGAGLTVGPTPVVAAASVGATSLTLSAATLTGTINAGDSFVVSTVTYYATGVVAASGNAVAVGVYPAVAVAIAANTAFSAYTVATYAPGLISVGGSGGGVCYGGGGTSLLGVQATLVTGFPSGATVELWLLDPSGADPTLLTNYYPYQTAWISAAGGAYIPLISAPGALVRVKGSTAGTATVLYTAD